MPVQIHKTSRPKLRVKVTHQRLVLVGIPNCADGDTSVCDRSF
ncbi:hypothetical protein BH23CHL1_BH23CHL1_02310 [soil metagenome]